jgi:hypothetical protein
MGYTCPKCNGLGIVNYDGDLPRYKQPHCPLCEGEGVVYKKQQPQQDDNCMLEPLEKIGLDDRDFFAFISSIEKETQDKIFTIRILEDEQDENEDNPHLFALLVFESREILKTKISTYEHEDKLAIRTQGKWL